MRGALKAGRAGREGALRRLGGSEGRIAQKGKVGVSSPKRPPEGLPQGQAGGGHAFPKGERGRNGSYFAAFTPALASF